jgi:hypothetical protein
VNLGKVALETHALLQIDFVMKHACHSVTIWEQPDISWRLRLSLLIKNATGSCTK